MKTTALRGASRSRLFALLLVGTALAVNGWVPEARAQGNPNPGLGIAPPKSSPHGATYGEWGARMWQWAYSMPVDRHPLFDTADCSEGQTGNVWFLGGSFAPSLESNGDLVAIVTRRCTIPSGKALVVVIANAEASTIEGNGTTEAELRAAARSFQDETTVYSCEIDGVSVRSLGSYRAQSPLYTFGPLPANNILAFFGYDAPAGATSPSVADGIQLFLDPLSVGRHTIHFHAETPAFHFLLDITYELTVVPAGRYVPPGN